MPRYSAARMNGYVESAAFAGPYLGDQLILPFTLAGGGAYTTVKPSQHMLTAIDITRRFTGRELKLEQQSDRGHLLSV